MSPAYGSEASAKSDKTFKATSTTWRKPGDVAVAAITSTNAAELKRLHNDANDRRTGPRGSSRRRKVSLLLSLFVAV